MIHNTHMSQFIPPTNFHAVTGTWTWTAGQVAGTISYHKAAAAETATINIPIEIPSNSVALNGAKLASVEIDYEILTSACTSFTVTINKVTRGIDTAVAVVTTPAVTTDLVAASTAATVDQHKLIVTLTTPEWIDNDVYFLVKCVAVCAAGTILDMLAAVANFTYRA
jgi:hypothetical protein